MVTESQLYHFCVRWSAPAYYDNATAEGQAPDFEKFLRDTLGADQWVFQLEDSWKDLTPTARLLAKAAANKKRHPPMIIKDHNLHFQGYIHVKDRVRCAKMKKIINAGFYRGAHIAGSSDAGKNVLAKYCMKNDTRIAGPWADRALYLGADLISKAQFTPDQERMHRFLRTVCPIKCKLARQVFWIYCPNGGSGKSAFKKYCQYHYGWCGFSYASAKDILYIVSKFRNKRVYFFNLSKSRSADVSENELYTALEAVKDGDFTTTKYVPDNVMMNPSHVVVFANHLPKKYLLTRGRIKIFEWKTLPASCISDEVAFDWGDTKFIPLDDLPDEEETAQQARFRVNPQNVPFED